MRSLKNPLAALQQGLRQWFYRRLPAHESITLTHRNVYILPTGAGWMLGLTVLVLLVASINYQLNLGYALTFLLAGSTVISMHVCHATLRGLALRVHGPTAPFAGIASPLLLEVHNPSARAKLAVALALVDSREPCQLQLPPHSHQQVRLSYTPPARGWQALPLLTAYTRYPLGAFHAWAVWRPAARVLVYPQPEANPPPLPRMVLQEPNQHDPWPPQRAASTLPQDGAQRDGLRPYRRGDPLTWIVWKKTARSDQWISREHSPEPQHLATADVWLDWQHTLQQWETKASRTAAYSTPHEQALGRLCAWVLQAQAQGLRYGLRLPHRLIAPGNGPEHQAACLQALALA